jgi:hypothetical protein
MDDFKYIRLSNARFDLKLFSEMNMNECKVMYLVSVLGGWQIVTQLPADVNRIEAIAINGKIFSAK